MKLAVIHHDKAGEWMHGAYFVELLSLCWKRLGIETVHTAGTRRLPAADAALLHVDMSRVPHRFAREALKAYPLVLNARILDIRKRNLPGRDHLVASRSDRCGPVILKTNLNRSAGPEQLLWSRGTQGLPWLERWHLYRASKVKRKSLYRVYPGPDSVPRKYWRNRDYVIERFLPEREGDLHVLRYAFFLGGVTLGFKGLSRDPVFRLAGQVGPSQPLPAVPPEVLAYRERIGLDYGRIDYVEHEGKPVILDVNKTIGGGGIQSPPWVHDLAAALAGGLVGPLSTAASNPRPPGAPALESMVNKEL